MVSYTLPGMTEFPDLNLLFLSFYRDARDIFFDDVAIESVYGGFPGSPLCGGRNNLGEAISLGDVEKCLARYRNLGVACNVTFTNQLATSAAIERDAYGKRILSLLDEQGGQLVRSPVRRGSLRALGGRPLAAYGHRRHGDAQLRWRDNTPRGVGKGRHGRRDLRHRPY